MKVKVIRQIGKNGTPTEVVGEIVRYSQMIKIDGEATALVKYDDGLADPYYHKVSQIKYM